MLYQTSLMVDEGGVEIIKQFDSPLEEVFQVGVSLCRLCEASIF